MITDIDLTIDRRTGDVVSTSADNKIVTQNVAKDPATTALLARYKQLADPIANRIIGTITADLPSARDTRAARSPRASSRWGT